MAVELIVVAAVAAGAVDQQKCDVGFFGPKMPNHTIPATSELNFAVLTNYSLYMLSICWMVGFGLVCIEYLGGGCQRVIPSFCL